MIPRHVTVVLHLSLTQALQSLKLNVQAGEDEEGLPIHRAAPISVLQSKAAGNQVAFYDIFWVKTCLTYLYILKISKALFKSKQKYLV